jgi:hypothetical protein
MTMGCPLNKAKRQPDTDEMIRVSGMPMKPSVLSSEKKSVDMNLRPRDGPFK